MVAAEPLQLKKQRVPQHLPLKDGSPRLKHRSARFKKLRLLEAVELHCLSVRKLFLWLLEQHQSLLLGVEVAVRLLGAEAVVLLLLPVLYHNTVLVEVARLGPHQVLLESPHYNR